ncbi:hypothetical protein ACXYMU_18065 [Pontibacter sp. CAU 1760]
MHHFKLTLALRVSLIIFLSGWLRHACHAQQAPPDSTFLQTAVSNVRATYEQAVGIQAHLYNGTEYIDYKKSHIQGSQFFVSKGVERGEINYDGTWYTDIPMLYDLVLDEVVLPHNSSGLLLKLIREKVDTFRVHGHTFVNLKSNDTGTGALPPGFYDLLFSQEEVQLLVKRSKQAQERATPSGMEGEFDEISKYYILKNGQYQPVNGKRTALRVLKDRKKQLQKYASTEKLKFRKQKETALLALVSYYASLPANQAN